MLSAGAVLFLPILLLLFLFGTSRSLFVQIFLITEQQGSGNHVKTIETQFQIYIIVKKLKIEDTNLEIHFFQQKVLTEMVFKCSSNFPSFCESARIELKTNQQVFFPQRTDRTSADVIAAYLS